MFYGRLMTDTLRRAEVLDCIADLPGWSLLTGRLHTAYDAPDVPTAIRLVQQTFDVAEKVDHHPDVDIRGKHVRVRCSTPSAGGVTTADVDLAHRIEQSAAEAGAIHLPETPTYTDMGIDTVDAEKIAPFWAAVLGYDYDGDPDSLNDPFGTRLGVWFQITDGASTGRNRPHIDVAVVPEQAGPRIDAALAAGGRLVTDDFAPRWWVLADADGNEACICTEEGRGF